jgi:hypothetical protein
MGEVIEGFRDRWAAIMKVSMLVGSVKSQAHSQPFVTKLVEKDVLTDRDLDTKRLKPFRLTAKRMEITRDRTSRLKWCYGPLGQLEKMARAMGHLVSRAAVRLFLPLRANGTAGVLAWHVSHCTYRNCRKHRLGGQKIWTERRGYKCTK